jgi:rRNA small subunit pseudouridine methyltransferase Nep1
MTQRLQDEFKRGRPDLLHITLLSVTSTPLYQDGLVKVFVHTNNDVVLEFEEKTRPPKSYARFRNLVEGVFVERPDAGLIRAYDCPLPGLLRSVKADLVVALSTLGRQRTFEDTAVQLAMKKSPTVLIGGFARGHFSPSTVRAAEELVRVDERPLDAHVVAARLIYEIEKAGKR